MMQALQQDFSALTSRDKMRFLRWAAESVGAKLDTVFSPTTEEVDAQADGKLQQNEEVKVDVLNAQRKQNREADIPEFLKR